MRTNVIWAALSHAFLGLACLYAQSAAAQDCNLRAADSIQLIRGPDIGWTIPVTLNGELRYFLVDTGGFLTQISKSSAAMLNLPVHQGRVELYDAVGNISRQAATVRDFTIGRRRGENIVLPISPYPGPIDGIMALDKLINKLDTDIDFGTGKMNFFWPDHCPGKVVYWQADTVAVVPMTLDGFHIKVPVTLDGHAEMALIDTGASYTSLTTDEGKRTHGLTLGDANTPENGLLNGDVSLKRYKHVFKSLQIGGVIVNNPEIDLIPNAMGRNASPAGYLSNAARSDRSEIKIPDMIIGLDVLEKLHIYFALDEKKLYITEASPRAISPYPPDFLTAKLRNASWDAETNPQNAGALNNRCYWRAVTKRDLDAALADCDKSLQLTPGSPSTLDSRAFVLYQQGKYQEALGAYDAALQHPLRLPASMLLRGYTKGKMGDAAGKNADVAAALAADANVQMKFHLLGVDG